MMHAVEFSVSDTVNTQKKILSLYNPADNLACRAAR